MEKKTLEAYMIVDMQFGSTGKGLLAGYLAETKKPDVLMTAWSPNAGHTYINSDGRKFVHTMLANGIVSPNFKTLLIGAGSVVNLSNLHKEIAECKGLLEGKKIVIHPNATIVTNEHAKQESRHLNIGSTMKGSAAANIQKMQRDPNKANIARDFFELNNFWLRVISAMGILISVSETAYQEAIENANLIQIEGAQGVSLSIQSQFYPYCTSRDVSPSQICSDICLPYRIKPKVYGTLRTFPIRVSNREGENGEVFSSGDVYKDQKEISYSDLEVEPELTTVTKLPRRVFTFSMQQLEESIRICEPDAIFLNFGNYLEGLELIKLMGKINKLVPIKYLGMGATFNDVKKVEMHNNLVDFLTTDFFGEILGLNVNINELESILGKQPKPILGKQPKPILGKQPKPISKVITDWANKEFPNRTISEALGKMVMEEIPEYLMDQEDRLELADIGILLYDIAYLANVDLESAMREKMEINKKRTWHKDPKTGFVKHDS